MVILLIYILSVLYARYRDRSMLKWHFGKKTAVMATCNFIDPFWWFIPLLNLVADNLSMCSGGYFYVRYNKIICYVFNWDIINSNKVNR